MKLKLDNSKKYALALEGGGAKGAYHIGAWKAMREAGIKFSAVSGTSVGALNGAMVAMDEFDLAEEIWSNIRYSQVINVDDDVMHKLVMRDVKNIDLKSTAETIREVVGGGGFDISPLHNLLREMADEDKIRNSDIEFFIDTYSLSDRKALELRAKDLEDGTIADMLLASSYLPVFRSELLGGKRYFDGALTEMLPINVLVQNGYTDIIAVRLYRIPLPKKGRLPDGVTQHTIVPSGDIGSVLEFDAQRAKASMTMGYYDAMRLLYGLAGRQWYIDDELSEEEAYSRLSAIVMRELKRAGRSVTLRELHEREFLRLALRLDAVKGSYNDLLIALLEAAAKDAQLEKWRIYTTDEFIAALREHFGPDGYSPSIAEALETLRIGSKEI